MNWFDKAKMIVELEHRKFLKKFLHSSTYHKNLYYCNLSWEVWLNHATAMAFKCHIDFVKVAFNAKKTRDKNLQKLL